MKGIKVNINRIIERRNKRQRVAGSVAALLAVASILAGNPVEWLFVASVAAVCYVYFAVQYFVALYKSRRQGARMAPEGRARSA